MSVVRARCPNCQGPIDISYVMLGAPMTCPTCGRSEIPEVLVGTTLPDTGWELSFADFRQLLGSHEGGTILDGLLRDWYGHSVTADGHHAAIQSSSGQPIDELDVHESVQREPDKQRALYQAAMALWQ